MIPVNKGFRMPPEWYRHQRTFMEWPVLEAVWPEPFEEVLEAFADTARKISEFEPVTMIVRPDLSAQAAKMCGPEIEIMELDHDDSWMRDNGPTFIISEDSELAGINWKFNAWGGKYPYEKDDLIAFNVLSSKGIHCFNAPLIMEGGSIHVDGEGTLLTTEECLLNKNRNPHLTKSDIEKYLMDYLGVKKIIWLEKGLFGDDTDGHIDNVACFAAPGKILLQAADNPKDPNYERTLKNLDTLKNATDAMGRKFEVITMPQPCEDRYEDAGLTLSYINFYFVNGGIILPVFGGKHKDTDAEAELVLKSTFPERKIVTVNGMPIIRGGGNVHCITQQMPEGKPAKLVL